MRRVNRTLANVKHQLRVSSNVDTGASISRQENDRLRPMTPVMAKASHLAEAVD